MSSTLDQIPGLWEFLKKRLRLPDAEQQADPTVAQNPVLQMPRPLPRGVESTAPLPPAPIGAPMSRPRVALPPTSSLGLGDYAVEADSTLPSGDVSLKPTLPTINYDPIRYDEESGRAINNTVRPRIADPTKFSTNRLKEMEFEGKPTNQNSRLKSIGLGLVNGFRRAGLAGALGGGLYSAARPDWDEEITQEENLGYEQARAGRLIGLDKISQDMEQQRALTNLTWLKPELEATKADDLRENRQNTLALRREQGESLKEYRNRTLGMKQDNNESMEEYRERVLEQRGQQFERTAGQRDTQIGETARHNKVTEGQGSERLAQGRERIKQGWALGNGRLDQGWARIEQGYERLDSTTKARVDKLAERAAAAESAATYLENSKVPMEGVDPVAAAQRKRTEAAQLRKQAEEIATRSASAGRGRYTEAEVRERARRTPGVDEEQAVKAARDKGLIK